MLWKLKICKYHCPSLAHYLLLLAWAFTYSVSRRRASLDRRSTTPHVLVPPQRKKPATCEKFGNPFFARGNLAKTYGAKVPTMFCQPYIFWVTVQCTFTKVLDQCVKYVGYQPYCLERPYFFAIRKRQLISLFKKKRSQEFLLTAQQQRSITCQLITLQGALTAN